MTRQNFKKLYSAGILSRKLLNKPGSIKQTYQIILDIKESGLKFIPGDCLGVMPENDPSIVSLCIKHMHAEDNDQIIAPNKNETIKDSEAKSLSEDNNSNTYTLKEYLTKKVNITKVKSPLLKLLLKYSTSKEKINRLSALLENKDEWRAYLETHELWDILKDFHSGNIPPQEICALLLPLVPRLYSISSAHSLYPDEAHLTVSYLEYETSHITRHGVTSHFLCKQANEKIKIFVHPTHRFFLPDDPSTPIIMIGTGAGIAPFISFIQHRYFQKASGKNWLFFGECNKAFDYYYESYLEDLKSKNFLDITTAFSRDQKEKIYVQHRLLENKTGIWEWIKNGAIVYVCGDARKMAVDIDKALLSIFQEEGSMDEAAAHAFLKELISNKHYLKDVY